MADTTTGYLGLTRPEVGASDDTWGNKINDNADKIDAALGDRTSNTELAPFAVPYAATITLDQQNGRRPNFAIWPLAGNITLAALANARSGTGGIIQVQQDGTGGRSIAFHASWKPATGGQSLSTAPNAIDDIAYWVSSAGAVHYSISRNF